MSAKNKSKSKNKVKNQTDKNSYKNKIVTFLTAYNKKFMPLNELETKCRTKKSGRENFTEAFAELRQEGVITVRKGMKVALCSKIGLKPAVITRLSRTFGFALTDDGVEYFIPGKCMMGAMPEDRVIIADIKSRSGEPEGEVADIIEYGRSILTGKIVFTEGDLYLVPDTAVRNHMTIVQDRSVKFEEGDKVLAEIVHRGTRHAEHRVRIIEVLGSSEQAAACVEAVLISHNLPCEFSQEVLRESKKISEAGVQEFDLNNREDLRDIPIFTIDSAEAKDLDDAVSVSRTENGYILGVHIADVSHYVKGNSELDKEAMNRGTSVYYADRVIPMLPKELSNGVCSLNPDENRLTLSCFAEIAPDGEILNYRFCKSVIKSRVKGIYSEVNKILDGTAPDELKLKYNSVIDVIPLMDELADKFIEKRKRRHAPEIETVESAIIIGDDGRCVGVVPRERGKAERIIEEFMLTANECSARLAREAEIPFVYRVHERPSDEKISKLCENLKICHVEYPAFDRFRPVHVCTILESVKDSDKREFVNMLVLRSMSKAVYSESPDGHFGLALKDYAHFTSPIRRYPDLAVHRILTDFLAGYGKEWLNKRYSGFAVNSSKKSTDAEIRAVAVERECDDIYKAEFMRQYLGHSFRAKISGVTEFGVYVRLENTVEGLVHITSLPEGEYDFCEPVALTEKFSGVSYKVGDRMDVICSAVNVGDGTVDFVPDNDYYDYNQDNYNNQNNQNNHEREFEL